MTGIDVSDFQPSVDWSAVAHDAAVGFVYAKATEGTDYTASTFAANHDGCKAQGIAFGAYHYFRPYADPNAQAQHFLTVIDGYEGQLLPAVDVEVTDAVAAATVLARLATFIRDVETTLGGKRMVIYTGYAFWQNTMGGSDDFAGHPLWLAEYNGDAAPTLPDGWQTWALWQFTDAAQVAGIGRGVDMSRTNNGLWALLR